MACTASSGCSNVTVPMPRLFPSLSSLTSARFTTPAIPNTSFSFFQPTLKSSWERDEKHTTQQRLIKTVTSSWPESVETETRPRLHNHLNLFGFKFASKSNRNSSLAKKLLIIVFNILLLYFELRKFRNTRRKCHGQCYKHRNCHSLDFSWSIIPSGPSPRRDPSDQDRYQNY